MSFRKCPTYFLVCTSKILECRSWSFWTRSLKSFGDICPFYSDSRPYHMNWDTLHQKYLHAFFPLYNPAFPSPCYKSITVSGASVGTCCLPCANCLPSSLCFVLSLSGVWCVNVRRISGSLELELAFRMAIKCLHTHRSTGPSVGYPETQLQDCP